MPDWPRGVDIIGFNAYRGPYGFGDLWEKAKQAFDRPVMITEFGAFAYDSKRGEDEQRQYFYFRGTWTDIVENSAEYFRKNNKGVGTSIGASVFHWTDQWYLNYNPAGHDIGGRMWQEGQPEYHDEWWGILSLGDGSDTLMRQKRKTFEYFSEEWNK